MRRVRAASLLLFLGLCLSISIVQSHRVLAAPGVATSATAGQNTARSAGGTDTRRGKRLHKRSHVQPMPVRLSVAVGINGQFRATTLVALRLTAHNRTGQVISGILEVPDAATATSSVGQRAAYNQPLTLPPYGVKTVTLYVAPTSILGPSFTVRMESHGLTVGATTSFGSVLSPSDMTIGYLTQDPINLSWIRHLKAANGRWFTTRQLTPATFDPVSEALANFDVIVVADGAIASLDASQLSALVQYVENGGGLLEVGGPGWQQSLKPLPQALVPGRVIGTSQVRSLVGVDAIGVTSVVPHGGTAISNLTHPLGAVLASAGAIPLVVDAQEGQGRVVYLAFDPTLSPIASWAGAGNLLTNLVNDANPTAASRPSSNTGFALHFLMGRFGVFNGDFASEMDNIPSPALELTIGFVLLAGLFVLLLGPVNFLLMGRLRRRGLLWISIPTGAVLCTAATFGVAGATRNQSVLVNSISMVTLGGPSSQKQADVYMGLFAPMPGTYHVSINQAAWPQSVINNPFSTYIGRGMLAINQGVSASPKIAAAGIRFQEGAQTQISFRRMTSWSMRNAEVSTSLDVPGRIQSSLTVNGQGHVIGWVRNRTNLTLLHPTILAGRSWVSLPPLAPGQVASVNVVPKLDTFNSQLDNESVWQMMLGNPRWSNGSQGNSCDPTCSENIGQFAGPSAIAMPFQPSNGYAYPSEGNFAARIRNVANLLPEAQSVSNLGEMLFIAWNQKPLLHLTVNGSEPINRSLNLIVQPLQPRSVDPGRVDIRTGTYGAQLVSVDPAKPNQGNYDAYLSGIDMGAGGSATFQFQLPPPRTFRFHQMTLNVNAGGANSINMGRVWDQRPHRWEIFDLSAGYSDFTHPERFVSKSGVMLIRLVNTDSTRDLQMYDTNQSIQISGAGYARP